MATLQKQQPDILILSLLFYEVVSRLGSAVCGMQQVHSGDMTSSTFRQSQHLEFTRCVLCLLSFFVAKHWRGVVHTYALVILETSSIIP
jgi:hypothetical protein